MNCSPKPRKINYDFLEKIVHYAAIGFSQKQICESFGFSETWCHAKKAEHSEFGEPYIKGSASGLVEVITVLYENAMNGNPVS